MFVTVKEWLKSVLNYRSYPKNKTGYPFFGPPCRWPARDYLYNKYCSSKCRFMNCPATVYTGAGQLRRPRYFFLASVFVYDLCSTSLYCQQAYINRTYRTTHSMETLCGETARPPADSVSLTFSSYLSVSFWWLLRTIIAYDQISYKLYELNCFLKCFFSLNY